VEAMGPRGIVVRDDDGLLFDLANNDSPRPLFDLIRQTFPQTSFVSDTHLAKLPSLLVGRNRSHRGRHGLAPLSGVPNTFFSLFQI
jgi:hypothetical protein